MLGVVALVLRGSPAPEFAAFSLCVLHLCDGNISPVTKGCFFFSSRSVGQVALSLVRGRGVGICVRLWLCVCAAQRQHISVFISGKIFFFFFLIVFFPFPQLSQILSGFYFVSGKEKGGQIRWKGLNNFPLFFFFQCVFSL